MSRQGLNEAQRQALETRLLTDLTALEQALEPALARADWAEVECQIQALDGLTGEIDPLVRDRGFTSTAVAARVQAVTRQCLDALTQIRAHRAALDDRQGELQKNRAEILTQWPDIEN